MPEPVVTTVITGLAGIVGALLGAIATHRFDQKQRNEEKEEKHAEEEAQLQEQAATVLGLVLTLVNDSHPMRARSSSEAKRIRNHWEDVRNQVFSIAVRYSNPQVKKLFSRLLDLVDNYMRHNANDEFRQKDSVTYFEAADNLLNEIKEILNSLRTTMQIEDMLDLPAEPRTYWGRGREIVVEETLREKRLEEKAKNLKVGETAVLLRSGLKVTLLGIYRLEQELFAGPRSVELKEGEVYLVAHVAVENIGTLSFEVRHLGNFELKMKRESSPLPRLLLSPSIKSNSWSWQLVSSLPESDWPQVIGEAWARSWEGKILRGEKREGYLLFKTHKDKEARLEFQSKLAGERVSPDTRPYSAKSYPSSAVWHLGEVASLEPLPDAMKEEWIKEKNERKEWIKKAVRKPPNDSQ